MKKPSGGHPPAVMLYIRFPLSLRNVEDMLHERGIRLSVAVGF
jgi:transposase-like protein